MTPELWRLAALCLLCAVVCVFLRRDAPNMAQLTTLAAGIFALCTCFSSLSPYFTFFRTVVSDSGFSPYAKILLRVCGIGFLTRFAADFCRDAGENTLAGKLELCGKCGILLCALPILSLLLEQIKELQS